MIKLNEKQQEAVDFLDGACLVLAGAGSGKTKVLTERIVKLIQNGVSPYNILAITFTNKAANEMRLRVSSRIGDIASNIFIGTFHSFGLKILRENPEVLGYKKNITILDSSDVSTIVKKIIKEMGLSSEQYTPRYMINKISFAKNEGLSPEEFSKYAKTPVDQVAVKVYEKYITLLKANNSVDFDDLLISPLRIFDLSSEVLSKYQEHYKYILVDEYQDTNACQYNLCKRIASKYKNIFVVGDIDQSIYGWRYANYRNVLSFEKDYPSVKTILLEENYRSTQTILNAANSVIKNNIERKEKNLWSNNDVGEKIKYIKTEDEKAEVNYVINEIHNLTTLGKKLKDIAVLYRTNAQSRILEEEFLKSGIPFRIVGSYFFYNRKEIKDLIAYLNLIYNKDDSISLERVINVPKRKIGSKTLEKLNEKASEMNCSMFDAISSGKELEFKNVILELIEDAKNQSLTELIESVLAKTGLRRELEETVGLDSEVRLENLEEFKSVAASFEEKGVYNLEDFLENIALVSDVSQYKEDADGVSLLTIHAAKGLEFDTVFIVGMEEGIFPHSRSYEDESELEEERRLCYVAITRAKNQLYLLNAKKRMLYGQTTINIPSRFVSEIDEDLIESNILKSNENKIGALYEEDRNEDLKPGDKVMHEKYGEGVVIGIDGSIASIAFAHPNGIKQIFKTHKSLSKKE